MSSCVHHWRQETGNLKAPFVCIHCGESRVMETDFYALFEARHGAPFNKLEDVHQDRPLAVA